MAIDPDPRVHVTSSEDFYALLSLPHDFTPEILRRAYRRSSKRFHPDKVLKPDASDREKEIAREKWDLFEVATKLLEDPALRSQYDSARAAREQKRKRDAAHDATRKEMIERLEAREKAAKRKSGQTIDGGEVDEDELEARRVAADGARRREAFMAKRKAEAEEGPDLTSSPKVSAAAWQRGSSSAAPFLETENSAPAEERMIRVRFPAQRESDFDSEKLEAMFEQFGPIDAVTMGTVKKQRLEVGMEKLSLARGWIQFSEKKGAVNAVTNWKRKQKESPATWFNILDVTRPKAGTNSSDSPKRSETMEAEQMVDSNDLHQSRNNTFRSETSQLPQPLPSVNYKRLGIVREKFGSYEDYILAELNAAANVQRGTPAGYPESMQMSVEHESSIGNQPKQVPSFSSFRSIGLPNAQKDTWEYKDAVMAKARQIGRKGI